MGHVLLYLLPVFFIASGFAWLSDRPGDVVIIWQGYEIKTSLFQSVILLLCGLFLLALFFYILHKIWSVPFVLKDYFLQSRKSKGYEVLSKGMIALEAGDIATAQASVRKARHCLPLEPLTNLLEAKVAHLMDDVPTARRLFEDMLLSPEKEQLGLRNLFLLAKQEGELAAAQHFAERAVKINPELRWSLKAQLETQCKTGDWEGAIDTVRLSKKYHHIDPRIAERQTSIFRTAQAMALEERDVEKALVHALEAHKAAPDLVPAAAIAGRILASRGKTRKALKIVLKTWRMFPHPDLARAYTFARVGDSSQDRLKRMLTLARYRPDHIESAIGVALSALEAREYQMARHYLLPFLQDNLTCRIACLMARIEKEDQGDIGRMKEWISRAVKAELDPAWVADGVVLKSWVPISPITGQIDSVEWRTPPSEASTDQAMLVQEIENLIEFTPSVPLPIEDIKTQEVLPLQNKYETLALENQQSLLMNAKRMLGFHSEKTFDSKDTKVEEITGVSHSVVAPDDPGLEGEDLVPQIRTSLVGPKN